MTDSHLRRLRDKTGSAATLINEGCKIVGTISGTGSFLVNGEVDGDCELDATLTLAAEGLWKGTIRASNVIVAGRVEDAELAVVNTCSFIGPARAESESVINDLLDRKRRGELRRVVVAGCLVQRYRHDLAGRFPDVDLFAELRMVFATAG